MEPIKIKLSVDTAAAAESVRDFLRETKSTLEGGVQTSVEKAKKQFDELGRKILQVRDIIEQNKTRQQSASEAEIANIKKVITQRELEILKLQEKRTKVGEVISLSTAGSEKERDAIRNATNDRIVAINGMKDQMKAQSGINDEVASGSSLLEGYFAQFLGIGGIIKALQMVEQTFEAQKEQIEGTIAAIDKFRQMNLGQYDTFKPFFNEMGIMGGKEQQAAQDMLLKLASKTNVSPAMVSQTATAYAPILKARGLKYDSKEAQGLIANGSIAGERGISPEQSANLLFNSPPNTTGTELNQYLSNVTAAAGSPSYANQIMTAFYTNSSEKMRANGLTLEDAMKWAMQLRQNGESYQMIPQDIGRAAQSWNRLLGLNQKERIALRQEFSSMGLGKLNKFIPTAQAGIIDIRGMSMALSSLTLAQQEMMARGSAGARGVVSMTNISGWQHQTLPTGQPFTAPDNPNQQAQVQAEVTAAQGAAQHPTSPGMADFEAGYKSREEGFNNDPMLLPWYRRNDFRGKWVGWFRDQFVANNTEAAQGQERVKWLLKAARDRRNLTNPNDITESDAILRQMFDTGFAHVDLPDEDPLRKLAIGTPAQRNAVLDSIKDDEAFIHSLPFDVYSAPSRNGTLDPKYLPARTGEQIDRLKALEQRTQPTTKPSVSYNIRQTNYGVTYDQIGAPIAPDNRYG